MPTREELRQRTLASLQTQEQYEAERDQRIAAQAAQGYLQMIEKAVAQGKFSIDIPLAAHSAHPSVWTRMMEILRATLPDVVIETVDSPSSLTSWPSTRVWTRIRWD